MHSHHSHSGDYCTHATGSLDSCISEAIDRGLSHFCLTEHIPRFREADLYPGEEQVGLTGLCELYDGFYRRARAIQAELAVTHPEFELLVGLETEYLREIDLVVLDYMLHKYPADVIVGSVHHVNGVPIDYSQEEWVRARDETCGGSDETLYATYLDHMYAVLTKLKPQVVGHFDVVLLHAPQNAKDWLRFDSVREKARRNIEFAVGYGALFELNSAALRKGWASPYPRPDIVAMVKQAGGRFCLSDDSHGPHHVALNYDGLQRYVREMDITEVFRVAPIRQTGGKGGETLGVLANGAVATRLVVTPVEDFCAWSARGST
ncbi:hypothetical protein PYCC9005_005604 [Savitreella phatthalungensis]